jgi:hypothetical protein
VNALNQPNLTIAANIVQTVATIEVIVANVAGIGVSLAVAVVTIAVAENDAGTVTGEAIEVHEASRETGATVLTAGKVPTAHLSARSAAKAIATRRLLNQTLRNSLQRLHFTEASRQRLASFCLVRASNVGWVAGRLALTKLFFKPPGRGSSN